MFEQLMQLPLFQGLSSEAISLLVEKYPFHFLKFHDKQCIIEAGEDNTHARFIVSGNARISSSFSSLQVTLSHTLAAPQVLGVDFLFGINTCYPYQVTAQGDCGVLQIKKSDYISMLQSDKVLLFNILNFLSLSGQRHKASLQGIRQCTVCERLGLLVEAFTVRTSADIVLSYRQKDLCALLGTQRNTLINAIGTLENEGLIACEGNQLTILDLRQFITYCKETQTIK